MVTLASALQPDTSADSVRTAARWRQLKQRLTQPAYQLKDSPSQVLSGFGKWRRMTVCARTGAEGER
jgi:transposase